MNSIRLPLEVGKNGLVRERNIKTSIDEMLRMLITTPQHASVADPGFGFVFNNLSFENFNENEGVVYNNNPDMEDLSETMGLYDKKISGSSKNLNTFASELRETIEQYETRLEQPVVSMTYIQQERRIFVVVKAVIAETHTPYVYQTIIKIWN